MGVLFFSEKKKLKKIKLSLENNRRALYKYKRHSQKLKNLQMIVKKKTDILENKTKELLIKNRKNTLNRNFNLLKNKKTKIQNFITKWFRNVNKIETNLENYNLTFNNLTKKKKEASDVLRNVTFFFEKQKELITKKDEQIRKLKDNQQILKLELANAKTVLDVLKKSLEDRKTLVNIFKMKEKVKSQNKKNEVLSDKFKRNNVPKQKEKKEIFSGIKKKINELEKEKVKLKSNNLKLIDRWKKTLKCLKIIQFCFKKHGIIKRQQTLIDVSKEELVHELARKIKINSQ